ncbi:MAG: DUF4145 domain-containing protein [Candidatus Margulisiibacteriota bacterium]
MKKKEDYSRIVDEIVSLFNVGITPEIINQVYFRTVTIIENLYGRNDTRLKTMSDYKVKIYDSVSWQTSSMQECKDYLLGVLKGIRSDISNELIFNLEKQVIGSVVADFLALSKSIAEDGQKDVAAVLASAAIEDALKRYSALNGLDVEGKDMSEVINAIKSKGLIKGPQASLLSSYVQTRNKAFHADWSKIDMQNVKSLISFTEEFILQNLS